MTDQDSTKPVVPLGDLVVGTILPYGALINAGDLQEAGWLYCDGRALDPASYPDLFAVIGTLHGGNGTQTFNLPDYRGYLLRGVDDNAGRDPDAATRTAAAPGGLVGDQVGSMQNYASGLATTSFTTDSPGDHTHSLDTLPTDSSSAAEVGSYRSVWNDGSATTDGGGGHSHTIQGGGDAETRPVNAYVNFLIRWQA
ncbi:phage tail protein [Streptomyces avermitilis]|uniref:phage tail protein n=1 Tax=Streptomyces avermitilis TaxID=33903 RepID=UPI003724A71D